MGRTEAERECCPFQGNVWTSGSGLLPEVCSSADQNRKAESSIDITGPDSPGVCALQPRLTLKNRAADNHRTW